MLIRKIREGSPASTLALEPGDELVALNGQPVRDRIDYRFLAADDVLELLVRSAGGPERSLRIEKDPDLDLGIEFEEAKIRECHNKCPFCFVDQSPAGIRKELDLRDDDYLLSFEHGNFVTLTNLKDWEFERILEQRLSPLYVSVHATDPEARRRLLVHKHAGRIMELLGRLAHGGIRMHTQAVICPGWNDGEILERTIRDLVALHPAIETLAVVPVGLTAHREGLPHIDPVTPAMAADLLDDMGAWQKRLLPEIGTRFVFPSDELFLLAGRKVPGDAYYEGFPQEENGVGMTRRFLAEWARTARRLPETLARPRRIAWVTGTLAAPVMQDAVMPRLARIERLDARLVVVENAFYGLSVTCAGLLAGEDITRAIERATAGDAQSGGEGAPFDAVCLPGNVLNTNDLFVDSMRLDDLAARVRAPVVVARDGLATLFADASLA
jgi:putative radical SAM enzyme (TIGR03279 family)